MLHSLSGRRVRIGVRIRGDVRIHVHRDVRRRAGIRGHDQRVDRAAAGECARCAARDADVARHEPGHRFAEREREDHIAAGNVGHTWLIVGNRHRWGCRVDRLHGLRGCRIRVGIRVRCDVRIHVHRDVRRRVGVRRHHQGVDCPAARECPRSTARDTDVTRHESGHRFAEGEREDHVATSNVGHTRLIIGDRHRRRRRVDRLNGLGRRRVRVGVRVRRHVRIHIHRDVRRRVGVRRHHQGVDCPAAGERARGSACDTDVAGYEPGHGFAECEREDYVATSNVGHARLIVGDRHRRRRRVDNLHGLSGCRVRIGIGIRCDVRIHIDCDVRRRVGIRCHHQRVDRAATRERPRRPPRDTDVTRHESGHGFAECEREDHVAAGNVGHTWLIVGDRHRRRRRVDNLHGLGRRRVRVGIRIRCDVRIHIDRDVRRRVRVRCHHQRVDRAATRERPRRPSRDTDVTRHESGHRFAECEREDHVAAGNVGHTWLIIRDRHGWGQRVHLLHALSRHRARIAVRIVRHTRRHVHRQISFEVRVRGYDQRVDRITIKSGCKADRFRTTNHDDFTHREPRHCLAERKRVGNCSTCDVRHRCRLVVRNCCGRGQRVHLLQALCGHRVRVAVGVVRHTSRHIHRQSAFEVSVRGHHQGVDRTAHRRERPGAAPHHHHVTDRESRH